MMASITCIHRSPVPGGSKSPFWRSTAPTIRAYRYRKPRRANIAAARRNGARVWSIVASDEGHGFAKADNANYRFMAAVTFARSRLDLPDLVDDAAITRGRAPE